MLKAFLGRGSLLWAGALACLALPPPVIAQSVWDGPDPVVGVASTGPPGVAGVRPHGVDLVLTGPNGHLYWQWPSAPGAYTAPTDLNDVSATSGPALVAGGRNKLDAFYRGKNGNLWTSWWDGQWWSAPTSKHGAWVSQCSEAEVGEKIAAVTVDEVFAMGFGTPNGWSSTGTVRIWRTAK
jgi:hypothetical protein